MSRFFRSALFPLVIMLALAYLAIDTLTAEHRTGPQPPASHLSLSEAQRPWYVLTDYRCFEVARALGPLTPAQRLELKARTVDEIGAGEPPPAAIAALLHLEASLRAEYRGERRTARREAQAGIRILTAHGAPNCARAFG